MNLYTYNQLVFYKVEKKHFLSKWWVTGYICNRIKWVPNSYNIKNLLQYVKNLNVRFEMIKLLGETNQRYSNVLALTKIL